MRKEPRVRRRLFVWACQLRLEIATWEKIAISRTMMRDLPLLLALHEPTGALDPLGELQIFARLYRPRTPTRPTHRCHHRPAYRFSIRKADVIVVLRQGRIIEASGHDELIAAGGN